MYIGPTQGFSKVPTLSGFSASQYERLLDHDDSRSFMTLTTRGLRNWGLGGWFH